MVPHLTLSVYLRPSYRQQQQQLIMKSNFEIRDAFLKNAHYYIELDNGLVAAAYMGKILIGPLDHDDQQQLKFMTKSIIVPASEFVHFIDILLNAREAYKTKSEKSYQAVLYDHSTTYQLLANWNEYEGSWRFSLRYRWFFNKDRRYLNRVALGTADPIKTDNNEDFIFLQRGVTLDENQVDVLWNQINVLLQHTVMSSEAHKHQVRDFVHCITSDENQVMLLKEALPKFRDLSFKDKTDILTDQVDFMLKSQNRTVEAFERESQLMFFSNKTNLVFALFNYYIHKQ